MVKGGIFKMACKNTIDKKIVRSLPKRGIKLPRPASRPKIKKFY
jgi:hypothetical protein